MLALGSLALAQTPPASANYWFSFGDSYTTTYSVPENTLPDVGNPMGNPSYPGTTSTGGPNWVGILTTALNSSLVLTYSYAYPGAIIDPAIFEPGLPGLLPLIDPIDGQFLAEGGAGSKPSTSPWTSENSLFSVWIGLNEFYLTWAQDINHGVLGGSVG